MATCIFICCNERCFWKNFAFKDKWGERPINLFLLKTFLVYFLKIMGPENPTLKSVQIFFSYKMQQYVLEIYLDYYFRMLRKCSDTLICIIYTLNYPKKTCCTHITYKCKKGRLGQMARLDLMGNQVIYNASKFVRDP